MSSPVQLSDLDLATTADDADFALIRKNNTTDYKVTVQILRNIDIAGLPDLSPTANSPLSNDLLLIQRSGTNSKCVFSSIGFVAGTALWFYANTAPVGWAIVPNAGDNLLAVKGGGTYGTGGVSNAGTWQQANATLTIDQIPPHAHQFQVYTSDIKGNLSKKVSSTNRSSNNTVDTTTVGGGQPHNHGASWRPLASVGIICQKSL